MLANRGKDTSGTNSYIYIYRIVSNLPWQLIRVNYVPTPFETAYETN